MREFPDMSPRTTGQLAVWDKAGENRNAFAIRTLDVAFTVYFDEQDIEHQGDIRYSALQERNRRTLASEGGRWRSEELLDPLHLRDLVNGQVYRLKSLPLGSVYAMPDGSQHTLLMYNYYPRPSKGANIEFDTSNDNNGFIVKGGDFTNFGNTMVTFLSHPNIKHFSKPSKSANRGTAVAIGTPSTKKSTTAASRLKVPEWLRAPHTPSPKASVRTPSRSPRYKKKAASRRRRVASAKRRRRRKATNRARSVSTDKLSNMRSTRRRRRSR